MSSIDRSRPGGCDFAVDPRLRADRAEIIWLPRYNPRLLLLTQALAELIDGPALGDAQPTAGRVAAEGVYVDLYLSVLSPANQALIVGRHADALPIALILPLDALFTDRLDTAQRVWRALARGPAVEQISFTANRRRRLKLMIRALDGSLEGEDYRGVAHGLFGDQIPAGSAFREHSLRNQTIRLVKDGLAMMRGGYLSLLRPERRPNRRKRRTQ